MAEPTEPVEISDDALDDESAYQRPPRKTTDDAPYSVVVNHLNIEYKVYGRAGAYQDPDDDGSALIARLLRKRRDSRRVSHMVHAVRDVSFTVRRGESVGIIGLNGSGKSTLLRAVAGLIPPTSGQVWVKGVPSLLGVNAVLAGQLSGERNIEIGAQALGMTPAEIRAAKADIIDFAEIRDFIHLPMNTYSSGMGARLRFAISTAKAPDILMIDEALGTGDARFRAKSQERIQRIQRDAGTIFLVSHSAAAIVATCERALWMHRGELVMDGPSEEVTGAYRAYAAAGKKTPQKSPGAPATKPQSASGDKSASQAPSQAAIKRAQAAKEKRQTEIARLAKQRAERRAEEALHRVEMVKEREEELRERTRQTSYQAAAHKKTVDKLTEWLEDSDYESAYNRLRADAAEAALMQAGLEYAPPPAESIAHAVELEMKAHRAQRQRDYSRRSEAYDSQPGEPADGESSHDRQ